MIMNISVRAYQHIRESLLNSGIYVGQKILHHELGQKLGISNTPLREAMFRLVAEGLLSHENYKGFSVSAITFEEAVDIYETRELIEPELAAKAAADHSQNLKVFYKIQKRYEQLISEPYHRQRILTDKKFHMEIARLAKNETLVNMLNQLYDKLILKSPVEQLSNERGRSAIAEHVKILDGLKSRDARAVYRLMKKHIQKQRDNVLETIQLREKGENAPFSPLSKS
jgi:DNA-binding GntR family transcriptional regulator